jgi:multiple sugar transport system ATP-binding protein
MAEIRIAEVTKSYGAALAIDRVSFRVAEGEFVVLVGPSGCGKSTLLRMIAGLEPITSGEIFIGGRRVNDVAPRERDVAMVFQSYALYPYKTVAENIAFPLRMRGEPERTIRERVGEVAGILGLGDLLGRHPRHLSGGQRQRVAMGRAIVRNPSAYLFDEPLSNLDAKLRTVMRGQIKELQKRLNKTTVFVTHDQVEAMTMADRIVVLRDGVVEQIGTPLELYDRPENPFVAGFIGSPAMNLFEGEVDGGDGVLRFAGPDGLTLPLDGASGVEPGASLTVGVRPEHLAIVPPDTPSALAAEVAVLEPTGAETVIVTRRGGTEIVVTTRSREPIATGERIGLLPEGGRLHVFGAGGRRIGAPAAQAAVHGKG